MKRALSLVVVAATAVACSEEPRPQIVLHVDTDAPIAAQALNDPTLLTVALVDTLQVTALDRALAPNPGYDRLFVLPEPSDWPLSFGVVLEDDEPLTLRLRAYRGSIIAGVDDALHEQMLSSLSIDRLVTLEPSDGAVEHRRVLLSLSCIGTTTNLEGPATCIDAEQPSGSPDDGIEATDATSAQLSRPAMSALARAEPCLGAAPPGAVCVPGGLSVIGDAAAIGFESVLPEIQPTFPLKAIALSPYWLDATEMSVGRFRALWDAGLIAGAEPATITGCTWAGNDPNLPLTCVSRSTASAACRALHGELPSEAQWDHAARGRGAGTPYPWGAAFPTCCGVSAAHGGIAPACGASAIEPVGSHPDPSACGGAADITPEGVLDLGGSATEMTLDSVAAYDDPCWGPRGLTRDPICITNHPFGVGRGGNFSFSLVWVAASIRHTLPVDDPAMVALGNYVGFRCAYPDVAP